MTTAEQMAWVDTARMFITARDVFLANDQHGPLTREEIEHIHCLALSEAYYRLLSSFRAARWEW